MKRLTIILAVVILPAWVMPAHADGIFGLFGKKAKVDPAKRVAELIITVKTEQDDRKRASAAAELGTFDALSFPEIVPVLVDIMQHDPKSALRMDAASSLGGLRPVSQVVGETLEKAASSDENMRVRLHAKSILMKYRIAGYSPGSSGQKTSPAKNGEPPLLDANGAPRQSPAVMGVPTSGQPAANSGVFTNASASKNSTQKSSDTPEFRPSVPRPLPQGPAFSTAMPQEPILTTPSPLPMVDTQGPPLTPPPPSTPTPQAPVSPF
jgi:HEAT repeats